MRGYEMIPELKAELVTAHLCAEKYKMLAEKHKELNDMAGHDLYLVLHNHAIETKEEYQEALTEIEKKILA